MTRYVALLRAINVGGHVVKMDVLKRHFEKLGLASVETFIASGNAIFESPARDVAKLERTIGAALEKALGYEVTTFVRPVSELASIAKREPFPRPRLDEATAFIVGFLAAPLEPAAVRRLMALRTDQSQSTFSNAVFEKVIGVKTTFRSMTTITKMAAKFAP
jgi:uncharacterized protein (DUF1697 family)